MAYTYHINCFCVLCRHVVGPVSFCCSADDLASDLILRGFQVQCIHGDRYRCGWWCVRLSIIYLNREQCDREQALEDFKTGMIRLNFDFVCWIVSFRSGLSANRYRCSFKRSRYRGHNVSALISWSYDDLSSILWRHVVNYDFPHHIEDYVHRIGRTGRAGQVIICVGLHSNCANYLCLCCSQV